MKDGLYRQLVVKTKTKGEVRIVKQETKDYGKPEDYPGKIRVRLLKKNVIEWIDEDEIIIPPKKTASTSKERKAKSDQLYKDLGYKTTTFKISPDNKTKFDLIFTLLKTELGFTNLNEAYNFLIEKTDLEQIKKELLKK